MWFVNEIKKVERLEICKGCEHYNRKRGTCGTPVIGNEVIVDGVTLRTCGCFMNVKASLKSSFCPLGKWSSVALSKEEGCELKALLKNVYDTVDGETLTALFAYKSKISGRTERVTTCAPCVRELVENLKKQVRMLDCGC